MTSGFRDEPDDPVRMLHVVNSLKADGGAERTVRDLVLHHDRRRFAPRVLCLYYAGELAAEVRNSGVPVDVLGLSPGIRPAKWQRVRRAVRAIDPAVVHTHLPDSCLYGLSAARVLGRRVRIGHIQNCYWHWPVKRRMLERISTHSGTAFIACSEAARRFCVTRVGYRPDQVRVIPNAVDFARFDSIAPREQTRERLGLSHSAPVLVSVGGLTTQKGHDDVIRSLSGLRERCGDAVLLVVGEGQDRAALESLARNTAPADAIRFLGRRDDVPDLLAAADIFVLASRWEGFGIAFAEAAAAGLPAVGTNVDGIPEVVEEGLTGLLVPPGDVPALAKALESLLGDPARRAEMGRAAAERATRFAVEPLVRSVEDLYLAQLDAADPRVDSPHRGQPVTDSVE